VKDTVADTKDTMMDMLRELHQQWVQFAFVDAMAYVGLFLAIQSGDWQLRVAVMKLMAPIFTAFDR